MQRFRQIHLYKYFEMNNVQTYFHPPLLILNVPLQIAERWPIKASKDAHFSFEKQTRKLTLELFSQVLITTQQPSRYVRIYDISLKNPGTKNAQFCKTVTKRLPGSLSRSISSREQANGELFLKHCGPRKWLARVENGCRLFFEDGFAMLETVNLNFAGIHILNLEWANLPVNLPLNAIRLYAFV